MVTEISHNFLLRRLGVIGWSSFLAHCFSILVLSIGLYSTVQAQDRVGEEIRKELAITSSVEEKFALNLDLAHLYFRQNIDSSMFYIQRTIDLAEEHQNDSILACAYEVIGEIYVMNNAFEELRDYSHPLAKQAHSPDVATMIWLNLYHSYFNLGDKVQSEIYLDQALQASNYVAFIRNRSLVLFAAAYFFMDKGEYLKSLLFYHECLELAERAGDLFFIGIIQSNLGICYQLMDDHERAQKVAKEALEISLEQGDDYGVIFTLFMLGESQFYLENLSGAEKSARKAIALSRTTGIENSIGYAYYQLGRLYRERDQLDSARLYTEQGLKISIDRGDLKEKADCETGLCRILVAEGKYEESIRKAKAILKIEGYIDLKLDLYEILSDAYERSGNYQKALEYSKIRKTVADSLESNEPMFEVVGEVVRKESQIKQDKLQSEYGDEVTKWKYTAMAIFGGLFFLFLILFVAYKNYLSSQQNQELTSLNTNLENRNNALKKFTFISSHDLLEPVRVINSMTSLLKRSLDQGDTAKNIERLSYIHAGAKSLEVMASGVREFTDVLNPVGKKTKFSVEELPSVINEWIRVLPDRLPGEISWDLEVSDITYVVSQVQTILKKLLENSFQANPDQSLTCIITGRKNPNEYLFVVKDNGIGINPAYHEMVFEPFQALENKMESQRSGLGLSICKLIVENNGGKIWLESAVGEGATVFFTVPRG